MINKILKIKELGKLNIPNKDDDSENTNDDFSFKKNTLIFGDNTCGKTTLVSVFKSLKSGGTLENRKKFKSEKMIQIKIESKNKETTSFHEYGKVTWKNEDILVFDNDFIKDNIFSEDQIKVEHLKSLPKILMGDEIKKDIDQINLIIKCDNGTCGDCEFCLNNKLNQHKISFSRDYQLEQFLRINAKVVDTDKQIKEKEDALLVDEKLSDLQNKAQGSYFYKLDIQFIEGLFDKKINNIFESVIEDHLRKNTNNLENAKGFLNYGLKLKKNDICPFCSQPVTGVQDFINNLSNYFDEDYVEFKDEIEKYGKLFSFFDLEKELLSFSNLKFILIEQLIDKEKFEYAFTSIKNKIEQKRSNLNFECDFKNDEDFILIKNIFLKSKSLLMEIINKKAFTSLEKLKINQELSSLKINRYRYSVEGIAFYDKYKKIEGDLKKKNEDKKKAQNILKQKVDAIFEANLKNINSFLKDLRADFKIIKFEPSVDNRDRNNYLKINEYLFEFVDVQGDPMSVEIDKFKETFSDSDKRLLGFAFFLSVLKNDKDLDDKIIILDDPFSSFDINRKEETIKLFDSIKNIDDKDPMQKIVFTHEKSFYCQLNKLITSSDKKLLKLNCSIANKGTMFELVDIKKFEADEYYCNLDYINNSITNNTNLDEALPKTRECAEYLLKAKYINTLENYRDNKGNPINFNINSVDSFLKALGNKCAVNDELSKLELHKFHHNQPNWKTEISDTSKARILEDFVGLIEKI